MDKLIKKFETAMNLVPFEDLPELLEFGRRERSKSQYYAGRLKEITIKEAKEFLKEIVEPFVKILKGML